PKTERSRPDRSCGAKPVLAANPRIASYARNRTRKGSQSTTKLRPRPSAMAMSNSASTTHSGSIEMPRHSITPKMRARYAAPPTRMRRDRVGRSRSRCLPGSDNRDRRDLDSDRERKCVGAKGGARVAAGVAEHLDQKIRGRVHDLGLFAEVVG